MRALALFLLVLISINAAAAVSSPPRPSPREVGPIGRFIAIGPGWDEAKDIVESLGGRVTSEFKYVGGVAFEGSFEIVETLSSLGYRVAPEMTFRLVEPVASDAEPTINYGAPAIGAPHAWAMGLTGKGVRVAILSTGIQNDHFWLRRGGQSVVKWEDDATRTGVVDYAGRGKRLEACGHGTHMAGIIASQNTTFRGVAPDADLYDIIVFSFWSDCRFVQESDVIRGIEHALMGPDGRPNSGDEADVIVLSFMEIVEPERVFRIMRRSISAPSILTVLERAAAEKVVVVPAGNTPTLNSFNLLCLAKGVICAGATYHAYTPDSRDDALAYFSSRGPGLPGLLVPHLLAPGWGIYSSFPIEIGEARRLSSTAASASFVSGAAAIMIQYFWRERLRVSPLDIMGMLMHTAKDVIHVGRTNTVADFGAGLIDLRIALRKEVLIRHNEFPFAHVYNNSGVIEIKLTSLVDFTLSYTVKLSVRDVYGLGLSNMYFKTPSYISVGPRETSVLRVNFSNLPAGTFGGFVILEGSYGTLRFPVLVTSPIVLSSADLMTHSKIIKLGAITDDEDKLIYFMEVKESLFEPLFISLIGESLNATVTVTLPWGGTASMYASSGYILDEVGTYMITVRAPRDPSTIYPYLQIRIVVPFINKRMETSFQLLTALRYRVDLLESTIRSLNTSLVALRSSLQALRNDLTRESEERRREIARIDTALSKEIEESEEGYG